MEKRKLISVKDGAEVLGVKAKSFQNLINRWRIGERLPVTVIERFDKGRRRVMFDYDELVMFGRRYGYIEDTVSLAARSHVSVSEA